MTARERVRQLAATDDRDAGCAETFALLDVYVELLAAGEDPEQHLPGVAAHLAACGPCVEDYRGLLAALAPGPDAGTAT